MSEDARRPEYTPLNSLEKKLGSNTRLLWGMFTAMPAAIIIQKFI
jgi:hypothetical protein